MAEIVLGIGTSHSPQLRVPPDRWLLFAEKDEKDPRFDYKALLKKANPALQAELTEENFRRKYTACQEALSNLRRLFRQVAPDAVIVVGDDQHEQFREDNLPVFAVYYGNTVEEKHREARRNGSAWAETAYSSAQDRTVPCDSELALRVIEQSVSDGFDVSTTNRLRDEIGIGHAFSFVTNYIMAAPEIPIVPVMINAFFPPNRPLPARCYALGQTIARAVRGWRKAKRVAVVASGGLSHFIIDEEIDRRVLYAIAQRDPKEIERLPADRLFVLGTGEALNWITAAGALERLHPKLLDYVPGYRTPAGTGCAMAFMQWT
jgi:AmmeMemoRadiSam system protein B